MTDLAVYGRLDALQERVAQLEEALEFLANATGVTLPAIPTPTSTVDDDPVAAEVADLLRRGKRSKAVSVAAKKGNLGIAEATAFVGEVEGRL